MVVTDFIGLMGPEYEMDVERGKIREFARAMHAPVPEFVEGRNPIVPATFLVTTAYTWGYTLERPRGTVFERIDHDLSVPLHAEESFEFHGEPPRAGVKSYTSRPTTTNASTATASPPAVTIIGFTSKATNLSTFSSAN